jgi:hypothetical protein
MDARDVQIEQEKERKRNAYTNSRGADLIGSNDDAWMHFAKREEEDTKVAKVRGVRVTKPD